MSLWGDTTILLASKSPRRRQLVEMLGIPFKTVDISVDETLDHPVEASLVAQTLAELKADGYCNPLKDNEILLTADTTVVLGDKVLGKPRTKQEAFEMLSALSNRSHEVYTGVCLKTNSAKKVFSECTRVFFRELSPETIHYYIDNYDCMDKAGAYGIQQWIGLVGVERIEGCYYNVMGLPVARICREISELGVRN
ncbi:MAG: septum formation protein Maf [Bacteroidales bacterium]|nr:septum formation protein Maf [Bacteroidales bacterium]MBR5028923.1 septum formation protein Maf [Bacteroidales bacterium]